jgi:hypothetical protein
MLITITNHHCDTRDIPVLGAGIVKLPAYGSVNVDFASDAQVRAFSDALSKKAPAAQMTVCIPIRQVVIPCADIGDADEPPNICDPVTDADVIVAVPDIAIAEVPEKPDTPKAKPQKSKKRGRKI